VWPRGSKKISDRNGGVLYQREVQARPAVEPQKVYDMVD